MPDYTPHQKKIIKGYYDHRDSIQLAKLGELVTELTLADTEKAEDRLWKRVATALKTLGIAPPLAQHIVTSRDPEVLARNLRIWLKDAGGKK